MSQTRKQKKIDPNLATKKKTPAEQEEKARNYKELLDKGIISQETYEKRIAELKNE